jgi:hypothetical protein
VLLVWTGRGLRMRLAPLAELGRPGEDRVVFNDNPTRGGMAITSLSAFRVQEAAAIVLDTDGEMLAFGVEPNGSTFSIPATEGMGG